MKVIYILGLGHSGTTLLSRMLGTHSAIVAGGGSKNVPLFLRGEKDCACGATCLAECDFWQRVDEELRQRGTALDKLDFGYGKQSDPFLVRAYYESIGAAAGASAVVDTARRVSYLRSLEHVDGIELIPVHIFKDPRAQAASSKRKGATVFNGIWNYANRSRRVLDLDDKGHDITHIAYEDLCTRPQEQLQRVLDRVGLEVESAQYEAIGSRENHVLGGNRQLRGEAVKIRLDESWRQRLSKTEKTLVRLANRGIWTRNMRAAGHDKPTMSSDD
ncbi:sulfotransferase [Gammaproteobacteria bacterium AB-CW1]|uniref:Sulfotransferase n=1 Tax=Natronospira elongata TaxID=3110268 RepID=A0AAP6JH14_9GAMM|nr:sulfotransferase [Gammaproteobacteria bacterium AB-CW1]